MLTRRRRCLRAFFLSMTSPPQTLRDICAAWPPRGPPLWRRARRPGRSAWWRTHAPRVLLLVSPDRDAAAQRTRMPCRCVCGAACWAPALHYAGADSPRLAPRPQRSRATRSTPAPPAPPPRGRAWFRHVPRVFIARLAAFLRLPLPVPGASPNPIYAPLPRPRPRHAGDARGACRLLPARL